MTEHEISGFIAPASWPSNWITAVSENAKVATDSLGNFQIHKSADHTLQTVLNATPKSLKENKTNRGIRLGDNVAFVVNFEASLLGAIRAQLVFHEFDAAGVRLTRAILDAGSQGLFVADPRADTLILSIRTVGQGSLTVNTLEFSPAPIDKSPPGLKRTGRATGVPRHQRGARDSTLNAALLVRNLLHTKSPIEGLIRPQEALELVTNFISQGFYLEAKSLIEYLDLYRKVDTDQLRKVSAHALKSGYLRMAHLCAQELESRLTITSPKGIASEVDAELEFLHDPWTLLPALQSGSNVDRSGPVIHMVGMAMPDKQRGYSLRTKYMTEELANEGIPQIIAVQSGGNGQAHQESRRVFERGVTTVQLPGPAKTLGNKAQWLNRNVLELYNLVLSTQPRAIHAHSDFLNGLIAIGVGRATMVPVVYEVRGFWEESFITRIAHEQDWGDIEMTMEQFGAPDLYEHSARIEREVREAADHVVTLSQTMKNYILLENTEEVQHKVTIVPNAVDAEQFSATGPSVALKRDLGMEPDDLVIGYISSLSAHEGIETLIDAYAKLSCSPTSAQMKLLIVGDGPHADALRAYARQSGAPGIIFTGRVQHSEIIAYYAVIDMFVVPRPRSRVTELVTPLKPFEAMAAGRSLIMSDLPALRELGAKHGLPIKYFSPEDSRSLAGVLEQAIFQNSNERRAEGQALASWARENSSWREVLKGHGLLYDALNDRQVHT